MTDYSKFNCFKVTKPVPFVLHVEFNKPHKLNAVDQESYTQYGSIFELAENDSDVRVIVLSGVGRAFCAGLDIAGTAGIFGGDDEPSRRSLKLYNSIKTFQKCISMPHFITKPHGPSIGLALDILGAVDIRYASKDTMLSVREIDIGMAADIGSLQFLPRIVNNLGWVKEVAMTGRNFGCDEAKEQGLINRVFETKDEAVNGAIELAVDLAKKSPVAMHGLKKSVNYAIDHTIPEGLEQIALFNAHGLGEDFMLGAMNARNKVKPTYEKL